MSVIFKMPNMTMMIHRQGVRTSTFLFRSSRGQYLLPVSRHIAHVSSSGGKIISNALQGRNVLVVGAGAIGLRTAWELLQHQANVILEAPYHPLHPTTCSMGAGGLWMPYHAQETRLVRWAHETLDELLHLQQDASKNLVEVVPAVILFREHQGPMLQPTPIDADTSAPATRDSDANGHAIPEWATDPRIEFQHLTVEMLSWQNIVYRLRIPPERELFDAGYRHAWMFRPPVVDPPRMLSHLLDQIQNHPHTRDVIFHNTKDTVDETGVYASVQAMCQRAAELNCGTVINCTGLGAARVCQDSQVVGARGILHHYERSSCVRRTGIGSTSPYTDDDDTDSAMSLHDAIIMTEEIWGSENMPCYLIPRGDVIVVGGSYLEGDTLATIRPDEASALLQNAHRLGIDVERSNKIGEWVGFRPSRSTVRCELEVADEFKGVDVFHSYGFGGSGWTLNVGAAKECATTLLKHYS